MPKSCLRAAPSPTPSVTCWETTAITRASICHRAGTTRSPRRATPAWLRTRTHPWRGRERGCCGWGGSASHCARVEPAPQGDSDHWAACRLRRGFRGRKIDAHGLGARHSGARQRYEAVHARSLEPGGAAQAVGRGADVSCPTAIVSRRRRSCVRETVGALVGAKIIATAMAETTPSLLPP